MRSSIFRKEAVEKISSPEDMNAYVKILGPRVWLLLAGIAVAAIGLVIFAISSGFPVWDLFFGNAKG